MSLKKERKKHTYNPRIPALRQTLPDVARPGTCCHGMSSLAHFFRLIEAKAYLDLFPIFVYANE